MLMPQTALDLVIQRFTEIQKAQIERLYWENETFYEICQDYAECIRMRDKYADDPTVPEAPRYECDYERLIKALEEEMRALMMKYQSEGSNAESGERVAEVGDPSASNGNHATIQSNSILHLLSIHPSFYSSSMNQEDENV